MVTQRTGMGSIAGLGQTSPTKLRTRLLFLVLLALLPAFGFITVFRVRTAPGSHQSRA